MVFEVPAGFTLPLFSCYRGDELACYVVLSGWSSHTVYIADVFPHCTVRSTEAIMAKKTNGLLEF